MSKIQDKEIKKRMEGKKKRERKRKTTYFMDEHKQSEDSLTKKKSFISEREKYLDHSLMVSISAMAKSFLHTKYSQYTYIPKRFGFSSTSIRKIFFYLLVNSFPLYEIYLWMIVSREIAQYST